MSQTTFFSPFGSLSRLSREQCEQIHAASLEILEDIGVRLYSPQALDLLKKAGAAVDEAPTVKIPHRLVEQALNTVPKTLTLYNRYGEASLQLGEDRAYFGPGSDCLNLLDHHTQERRKPTLEDVRQAVTLADALPNIDFVMSMLLPCDIDQTVADIYQAEIMFNHTAKPLILVSYETRGLVAAVEMAEMICGGTDNLRQKPFLTCYINVVSGAIHNQDALQKLLYLSSKGLPTLYVPGSNAGVTSPATMAGATALDNAGGLVGIVLTQLNNPGSPVIYSAMDSASLDMRTMISPYAYAERGIMRSMARYYGLPCFSLAGATDAKIPDQQAAAEASLSLLTDAMMGGNLIHDLGYLESGLTFSFAQLVICDQIVDWIRALMSEIEVNPESLALDVVRDASSSGKYLSHPHTRRHYREIWYPQLFERGTYTDWISKGGKPLAERAAEKADQLLAEHEPPFLPPALRERIRQMAQSAASL